MTDEFRKEIARKIIGDAYGEGDFWILSSLELRGFYNVKNDWEPIPSTLCCARDEARRILGESESTKLSIQSLKR